MSASELVRRASQRYGEQHDAAALDLLAAELERSTAELRAELTDVLARVDKRRADIRRMRAERV